MSGAFAWYLGLWSLAVFVLAAKNVREMHHIYVGLPLVLLAGGWLRWVGVAICLDDALLEHAALGLTGKSYSPLLWLYGKTLWKLAVVRWLAEKLNALFGKPSTPIA